MPDLLAGTIIRAADRPASVITQDTTTQSDITSTTFTPGSPVVDVTFTTPTSGRVLLIVSAGMQDDSADERVVVSAEVYEGSDATGTLVLAANAGGQGLVSINVASSFHKSSRATLLTLTPTTGHYARVMHRVLAGSSADIGERDIAVIPVT